MSKRLALKVDCDTYVGTQEGIPALLSLFDEFNIKASFFFTLGPDNSGRAAFRIFTQKGFLKKMIRSNAAALYGPKTMLYGTLLPGPMIGKNLASIIKSVAARGHEGGVHGWDHVKWHDNLGKMTFEKVKAEVHKAHDVFNNIFGFRARSSAAPGWHATENSRRVFDSLNLLYTSDTRGGTPFFPLIDGQKSKTLDIPSTLPTWDEMWGDPRFSSENDFLNFFTTLVKTDEVHSIHTEVEGMARLPLFREQLKRWRDAGVTFVRLDQMAEEVLKNPERVPSLQLRRIQIPNRGGFVSAGEQI